MARQKNKSGEPSVETPAADAPEAPPVEGATETAEPKLETDEESEVAGTVETTEAPPVEGAKADDVLPPQDDETKLSDKGDDEGGDAPAPTDPEEPARHLFHDEEVLVDRALALAKRKGKLEELDDPSAEDLANVRRQIAVDVIRNRALVETWCAKTEAELPKPAIIGFRVWAHGEFHIDGKVHRPGDIIQLPESYAEQFGPVLEPVTE